MPGDIRAKERTALTLSSASASLSSGSVVLLPTNFSALVGGNAEGDFAAQFDLLAQWATVTGIAAGTAVAELYLVPSLNGTDFPDVDTTAGAGRVPSQFLFGVFEASKVPTASVNMRFATGVRDIAARLYRPYLKNTSGQTMAAGWVLLATADQARYT